MAKRPQELLRLLTRAERLATRRLQSALEEFDCSVEAWWVLDLLSDGQGHHMTALADHAFLPAPSATKLIDQLVDQNLVFRRVDPADRRRVLAYLTPRGRERRQRLVREVRAERARWEPLLGEEGERLEVLLDRLAEVLEGGGDATTTRAERAVGRGR
ncbi:MarR family transcriptional regulator [Streptomyces maremycinicus]|nr:MarR family transcriptional regulator [Streptomyces sp. B9173]